MRSFYVTIFLSLNFYFLSGQVAINTDGSAANNSAMLDIKNTSKGVLLPRVTTSQRRAILSPAQGLIVFDTDKNSLFLFDGVSWQALFFMNPNNIPPVERKAGDDSAGTSFGLSVGISGDYAVIGAPNDEPGGSAYIFYRAGGAWTQQAKLVASDAENNDGFGGYVSISGDYAIVGALGDDVGANIRQGSAYVFLRTGTTWSQHAKLLASDGNTDDAFGVVSISGTRAVVGAPGREVGTNDGQGAAYVFFRSGTSWIQQQKIAASDGYISDQFGYSVSMSGTNILIGALNHNSTRGAAYFYTYNVTFGWISAGKVTAPDAAMNDFFGSSVSISGNYAVIGAPQNDLTGGTNQGSAYIFFLTGGIWTFQDMVTAFDGTNGAGFGHSVSIDNDQVLIGAIQGNGGSVGSGSAYIYKRAGTQWDLVRKIIDPDGGPGDRLGYSCSISGMNVIIGADGGFAGFGKIFFLNID